MQKKLKPRLGLGAETSDKCYLDILTLLNVAHCVSSTILKSSRSINKDLEIEV